MAIRLPPRDLYADLGVAPDATAQEVASAFRSQARRLHPDANPTTADAERFKRVTAAYGVLSHPGRRARDDAARTASAAPAGERPGPPPAQATPPRESRPALFVTRARAPWVMAAGVALLAGAAAVVAWVTADPGHGRDATGRTVTLWIVAVKLVVGGVAAIVAAARRLRSSEPVRSD